MSRFILAMATGVLGIIVIYVAGCVVTGIIGAIMIMASSGLKWDEDAQEMWKQTTVMSWLGLSVLVSVMRFGADSYKSVIKDHILEEKERAKILDDAIKEKEANQSDSPPEL